MSASRNRVTIPTISSLERKYGKAFIEKVVLGRSLDWELPSPLSVIRAKSNVFLSSAQLMEPGIVSEELDNIRHRIKCIEEERDHHLYIEIARAFDLAEFLAHNKLAWVEYCRAKKWQNVDARSRPKFDQNCDALRVVVTDLCLEIPDPGRRKKRLNLYFSALRELQARNVAPNDACDAIRDTPKGLSGLRTAWALRMRKQRAQRGFANIAEDQEKAPAPKALLKRRTAHEEEAQPKDIGKNAEDADRYVRVWVRNNKCLRTLMRGKNVSSGVRFKKVNGKNQTIRLDF